MHTFFVTFLSCAPYRGALAGPGVTGFSPPAYPVLLYCPTFIQGVCLPAVEGSNLSDSIRLDGRRAVSVCENNLTNYRSTYLLTKRRSGADYDGPEGLFPYWQHFHECLLCAFRVTFVFQGGTKSRCPRAS